MDARRTSVDRPRNEVDTWLRTCDICVHQATNPVAAPCGHLFCSSCLDYSLLDGPLRRTTCPICNADNFSIVESVATAWARRTVIVSAAATSAGNNMITMTGPVAAGMRFGSLISRTLMEVVQPSHVVDDSMQVDLIRISSNCMAQRIQDLRQAFERVAQANLDLRRKMEVQDELNRRLRGRIAELENLNGRIPRATPLATRPAFVTVTEEQPVPESVEDGSSSTNSQAGA